MATLTLCAVAIVATAQGFESLRRTTVAETKASPTLAAFLDQNDAEGLRSFLKANPHSVNDGTLKCAIKTGARRMKSLLYDAVERTLAGQVSPDVPAVVLQAGASFTTAFEGKTPIYLVLDYLARHKKSECATAEQLLQSFVERSDFDANMRYRSLLPPLAYLIRENYQFLGNRFSADYISDNALRTLIEHGASINTYNTDGGTLMAFATATNNEYMQSYIIGNGIDLTHADQSGNDDIYRTIDAGNLPLLRQMIERAHVKVDINTLKNNTADVRQRYSELYDFLATHCARQAQGYDEVTLFRQRFDDKKPLVQQKYETLAEAEAKGATSFAHFMRVQERYPGTESLLNGRKLEIYHGDCSQLAALYQRTVQVAEAGAR